MEKQFIEKLEMKNIYKEFPGVIASNYVSIDVNKGEVLGLLGENGAGKTTLMNILFGLYRQDSGNILINGKEVKIHSPKDAINLGIGMVHQHFMLIPVHTVAENIALGLKGTPFYNPSIYIKKRLDEFYKKYGLKVDPDAKIWQLSAGEQQRVEIIKTLLRGASLLILDEPTSVLTPSETKDLFNILNKLKEEGHSIIFITHKLEEVMDFTDRVAVLRKGNVIGTKLTKDTNRKELAKMMIGREVVFNIEKKDVEPGKTVLKVENLNVLSDRNLVAVKNLSFEVKEREILGIAGVSGNGQKELIEAITGLRKVVSGKIYIKDKDITNNHVKEFYKNGVGHIPEERMIYPIVPDFSLFKNTILKTWDKEEFQNGYFLDYKKVKSHTKKIIENFQVYTPSIYTKIKFLSGGNIQKFILGREFFENPIFLVAAHPTYGLDVGATEFIRKKLLELRDNGKAVLLVSEDLEEIFAISDRIAVMYEGEFMGIVNAKEAKLEDIGLMMAGSKRLA